MTIQTELRRLAALPILAAYRDTLLAAARKIDAVEAESSDNLRLKRRVNELVRVVLALKSSARFAEAAGVNTEPEE